MVTALVFMSVLSMLALGMLGSSLDSSKWTSREADSTSVESSAESVMAVAVDRLWAEFMRNMGNGEVKIWDFQAYLNTKGITDKTATDLLPLVTLATDAHNRPVMGDVVVESLQVTRRDDWNNVRLTLEAVVGSRRESNTNHDNDVVSDTVRGVWRIEAADWEGLDFAMLANNINCILCHTDIDNAQRYYNSDPSKYGTFDRVKLGSLETFELRHDPATSVAGTVYLGGGAMGHKGDAIHNWSTMNFKSRQFDGAGKLTQDAWGDTAKANLSPANPLDPKAYENLYLDYLAPGMKDVDGYMPDNFPSPFPDDGGFDYATGQPVAAAAGNRTIDDSEFSTTSKSAYGTLSGGTISLIAPGQKVNSSADVSAMTSGNKTTLKKAIDGNVYLHGTKADPIVINGKLAVDGDLFISGYVKGKGALNVRNNVYILDSLKYADHESNGSRKYGEASDGTENALAIASGGNISVGDVFRPSWGANATVTGDTNGHFSFILDEMSIFNRMEWMKTQPTLPGEPGMTQTGTKTWTETHQPKKKVQVDVTKKVTKKVPDGFKNVPKYKWKWKKVGHGKYAKWKKVKTIVGYKKVKKYKWVTTWETTKQWKWVNDGPPIVTEKSEPIYSWGVPQHTNPFYEGVDYLPRYYAYSGDTKFPIFNKDGFFDPTTETWRSNKVAAQGWGKDKLTIVDQSDTTDPILYDANGKPKAVVSTIGTSEDWMSLATLRGLVQGVMSKRAKGTVEIDATLYSNNGIFGVVTDRAAPTMNGKMLINGGLVAADVGLLAPKGTQLNYDSRGRDLLDINDNSRLKITRLLWVPAR